jgi:hypothetical protein
MRSLQELDCDRILTDSETVANLLMSNKSNRLAILRFSHLTLDRPGVAGKKRKEGTKPTSHSHPMNCLANIELASMMNNGDFSIL